MTFVVVGLLVLSVMAFLLYRKRKNETFFDPHHQQAFDVLEEAFPESTNEGAGDLKKVYCTPVEIGRVPAKDYWFTVGLKPLGTNEFLKVIGKILKRGVRTFGKPMQRFGILSRT